MTQENDFQFTEETRRLMRQIVDDNAVSVSLPDAQLAYQRFMARLQIEGGHQTCGLPILPDSQSNVAPANDSTNSCSPLSPTARVARLRDRFRHRVSVAFAFGIATSILVAVFGLIRHFDRYSLPPTYEPSLRVAGPEMGVGGATDAGFPMSWPLPDNLTGFVVPIEVYSNGTVQIRGQRDRDCQMIDTDTKRPVILDCRFRPDSEGDKIVWLLLTDRPAIKLLRESDLSAFGKDLRKTEFSRRLFDFLLVRGIIVRATGRIVIPQVNAKDNTK